MLECQASRVYPEDQTMRFNAFLLTLSAALVSAAPVFAQNGNGGATDTTAKPATTPATKADTTEANAAAVSLVPRNVIQHVRPQDQRGLHVFEAPKEPGVPFTGFQLSWGAAFTQQFQGLRHENSASPKVDPVTGVDANRLMDLGNGFNNATANLYLNAQLAKGIRVALTSYLSSRHHNETWVKDGYLLVDASPIAYAPLEKLMEYVTIKAGHFELNYGDAHFRRTDNGQALYNPFVGNLILDAFTTEIGGEVYLRAKGLMGMVGITGGEVRGQVASPRKRSPAVYGKVGVDRQVNDDLRLRLTGSLFSQSRSMNQTLFAGDRAGSRYYSVVENTASTEAANFRSGMFNPGFGSAVNSYQINPFVKFRGLEAFGVVERARGASATEAAKREFTQYAGDLAYRFLRDERAYVAARYNTVEGRFAGMTADAGADRYALAGGWFITPIVLLKGEWVNQKYTDFPTTDIRNGAKFKGFVMEGVVAF
jgi:hypothetical protein